MIPLILICAASLGLAFTALYALTPIGQEEDTK